VPWTVPDLKLRDKPVTLGNLREHRIRRLLVFCGNPKCKHQATIEHFPWPDDVTLSDFQPRMLCKVCGHLGADVRPDWDVHGKPGEFA
jgi:hypothetical protein